MGRLDARSLIASICTPTGGGVEKMNIRGADSQVYCLAGAEGDAFAQQYCHILLLRPDGYLRLRPRRFNYRNTGGNAACVTKMSFPGRTP